MSQSRAMEMLDIISMLEGSIRRLGSLQVGDYQNKVSPIKHELRDAIAPITAKLRQLAQAEYTDTEHKLSGAD